MFTKTSCAVALLAAVASADFDPYAKLDKPSLTPDLDYLRQGLSDNLTPADQKTWTEWNKGWIPKDCKDLTEGQGLNAADITAYEVKYSDCDSPWHLCHHKDSPATVQDMTDLFGRVPVKSRSWVRHVVALPDPVGPHAFNADGNLVFFAEEKSITTFIHETAHSLDTLGALKGSAPGTTGTQDDESQDQNWLDNYNQDPKVPDNYAQSNMVEDVAQATVIATYNVNVPGGFEGINDHAIDIFHQYATIQTRQRNAGNLLVKGGTCGKRLENSEAVESGAPKRMMSRFFGTRDLSGKPDVSLAPGIEVIPAKKFNTKDACKNYHKHQ